MGLPNMDWILCAAIGVLAGLIAGLFGAAGGWVLVPALTLGLPYAGVHGPGVIKVAIASTHALITHKRQPISGAGMA